MIDQIESFISWPSENNQLVSMLQNGASFAMGYFVQLLIGTGFGAVRRNIYKLNFYCILLVLFPFSKNPIAPKCFLKLKLLQCQLSGKDRT